MCAYVYVCGRCVPYIDIFLYNQHLPYCFPFVFLPKLIQKFHSSVSLVSKCYLNSNNFFRISRHLSKYVYANSTLLLHLEISKELIVFTKKCSAFSYLHLISQFIKFEFLAEFSWEFITFFVLGFIYWKDDFFFSILFLQKFFG